LDSSLNDITADTTFVDGSVAINGSAVVPEPQTGALLFTALLGLVTGRWFQVREKPTQAYAGIIKRFP
jgi:hypothetical protein